MKQGNKIRISKTIRSHQILITEEVADYLNVDRQTVYRLVHQKQLPAFKIGNQWRFKRKMIGAWLRKKSKVKLKRSR